MISNGARPTRLSHKDYDFFKSHKFGSLGTPTIPDEYFADCGLTMPNQNQMDTEFTPPTPPMPFGCTDFAQADLRTDLIKEKVNPNDLEAVTKANARGGIDIRESLDAAITLGWFKQYFNIRAKGVFDFLESFQLAQMTGLAAGEARAITWGTPWFATWENAVLSGQKIMPMPSDSEFADLRNLPWHNSVLDGWTTLNGVQVYRNKSLQGNQIGDKGFIYFPREVINRVMTISGTVAYTATNVGVDNPLPIDLGTIQFILSWMRNLLNKVV